MKTGCQSYKIDLDLKNTKLFLNSLTMHYFNLNLTTKCSDIDWGNTPSRNVIFSLHFFASWRQSYKRNLVFARWTLKNIIFQNLFVQGDSGNPVFNYKKHGYSINATVMVPVQFGIVFKSDLYCGTFMEHSYYTTFITSTFHFRQWIDLMLENIKYEFWSSRIVGSIWANIKMKTITKWFN